MNLIKKKKIKFINENILQMLDLYKIGINVVFFL